jgi:hypothetical protein
LTVSWRVRQGLPSWVKADNWPIWLVTDSYWSRQLGASIFQLHACSCSNVVSSYLETIFGFRCVDIVNCFLSRGLGRTCSVLCISRLCWSIAMYLNTIDPGQSLGRRGLELATRNTVLGQGIARACFQRCDCCWYRGIFLLGYYSRLLVDLVFWISKQALA